MMNYIKMLLVKGIISLHEEMYRSEDKNVATTHNSLLAELQKRSLS